MFVTQFWLLFLINGLQIKIFLKKDQMNQEQVFQACISNENLVHYTNYRGGGRERKGK